MVRPAKLDTVPREVYDGPLSPGGSNSDWIPIPMHASCATITFERTNLDAVITFRVRWRTEDGIQSWQVAIDGAAIVSAPPLITVPLGIVDVVSPTGDENFDYTVALPANKAELRVEFNSQTADPGDVRISVSFA